MRSYSCERWNRVPPHPSRNEFRGLYDFKVLFEETPKISKSMPWTFSRKLMKLFCNINAAVPIQFHFGGNLDFLSFHSLIKYGPHVPAPLPPCPQRGQTVCNGVIHILRTQDFQTQKFQKLLVSTHTLASSALSLCAYLRIYPRLPPLLVAVANHSYYCRVRMGV